MTTPIARPSKKEQEAFRKQCLYGMAKGPWANWWANEQEEKGRSFSQQNIYDLCPEPPPAARKWARDVYEKIAFLNTYFPEGMTMIFAKAKSEGFAGNAEEFGFYLGCQVSGMGIAWDDDLSTNYKIELPHQEFYI